MPHQPRQLTVVSGKGGTGKTTVLASFAALAENAVLADCDVDAANLHLLLDPEVQAQGEFQGARVAVRDPAQCGKHGECERRCRFGAITPDRIDVYACEGCALCTLTCPNGALTLEPIVNGQFYQSTTRYGPMAHARLLPGGESSGRLVTKVRQLAEDIALREGRKLILNDGPPGIGCTAVAALAEVDLAIIVTEPTLSGIHDMERVVDLVRHFGLPVAVINNKADLNAENSARIKAFCEKGDIALLAELPFDEVVPKSIGAAIPLVEYDDGAVSQGIAASWHRITEALSGSAQGCPRPWWAESGNAGGPEL